MKLQVREETETDRTFIGVSGGSYNRMYLNAILEQDYSRLFLKKDVQHNYNGIEKINLPEQLA